jgi:hypothetical protein
MAKKDNEVTEKPRVTHIPLPISDSALVIDLPDGQKLVVGKMTHGTVIEVATWRGTGRPDSRTNRMMLGMSNSEIETQIQEEEQRQAAINPGGWRARLLKAQGIALALAVKAKSIALGFLSKRPKDQSQVAPTEKSSSLGKLSFARKSEEIEGPDDDIQAWLDKVTARSIQKKNKAISGSNSARTTKKASIKKVNPRKK